MTKLRTIKEKTELKKIIANTIGNTGILMKLAVWNDGSWQIHSGSTLINPSRDLIFFGTIASLFEYIETDSKAEMKKDLTQLFKSWEEKYIK